MLLQRSSFLPSSTRGLLKHHITSHIRISARQMATHNEVEAREAKKAQRKQMRETLSKLSGEEINLQSERAQDVILGLPQYQRAKRVGIYMSMPKAEAQTGKLVQHALNSGKSVFVPYIYPVGDAKPKKKVMDMLNLKSIEDYESLEKDSWGIPKLPREGREERENAMGGSGLSLDSDGGDVDEREVDGLDLIVVPAVAFDRDLNRMGHGAGFYDRYLSRFCKDGKRAKPFLVGLCLAEQIIESGQLVMQEWDWRVDAVAVGDGSLLTSKDTQ